MKFTHYYSNLLKSNGVPHIGVKQYQYIFNLMALEMRIDELNKLLDKMADDKSKSVLQKRRFNLYSKHNTLTKGKEPEDIMRALIESINL